MELVSLSWGVTVGAKHGLSPVGTPPCCSILGDTATVVCCHWSADLAGIGGCANLEQVTPTQGPCSRLWRWSPAPNLALDEGSLVAGDSHLGCSLLGQLG